MINFTAIECAPIADDPNCGKIARRASSAVGGSGQARSS